MVDNILHTKLKMNKETNNGRQHTTHNTKDEQRDKQWSTTYYTQY